MFDDIKLYGTLVKTIKNNKTTDYNHNTYISYDHTYKKFYLLLLGQNSRYIAVAHDFAEMETMLTDFKNTSTQSEGDKFNLV